MVANATPPDPRHVVVEIDPLRASVSEVVGAVDAALASDLSAVRLRVALAADDPRRAAVAELCRADERVEVVAPGSPPREADLRFELPASARPQPHTLPLVAAAVRGGGLATVEVPVPGRLAARRIGMLRAHGGGAGARRLKAAEVGLGSVASRRDPSPRPEADLAAERAEHLRQRARSATLRARLDRNRHRLAREELQVHHERARLALAEERLGRESGGEWLRWRGRQAARRIAATPRLAGSAYVGTRAFARRGRRFLINRARQRRAQPADQA